jgi:hypothetical protein
LLRGCSGRFRRRGGSEGGDGEGAVDNVVGDVEQAEVVGAGVVAQCRERLFHVEALALGHHAFGLLDDDAAVEGVVQLFVYILGLERGSGSVPAQ